MNGIAGSNNGWHITNMYEMKHKEQNGNIVNIVFGLNSLCPLCLCGKNNKRANMAYTYQRFGAGRGLSSARVPFGPSVAY